MTYTFNDKEKKFQLTVSKDFLETCPNPEKYTHQQLNADFYMFRYLHNPDGPAVIRLRDGRKEYVLNTTFLNVEDPETMEKIIHKEKFQGRLETLINNE